MALQITPQPGPEEREALIRALAVLNGARDRTDPWWQAGIREAVEEEPDES